MALYWIGDVQGCDSALSRLLAVIDFSPSRDTLYLLGDLVNRGPDSLAVLERLIKLGSSAHCILGNHDLHLLGVAYGARKPHRLDTCSAILNAPSRATLTDWLRRQPLARDENGVLMVHAGVLPQWTRQQVIAYSHEVSDAIGPDRSDAEVTRFFSAMYGNRPDHWRDDLTGIDRLRVVVNALTRLRFCTANGVMEFEAKESADTAPEGYLPWFDVPDRATSQDVIAFGHWSTLGLINREKLIALDTGCVWGGCLSAVGAHSAQDIQSPATRQIIQVKCEQAQKPGG
jgi:bis(5'-nucleosyl)-tetraphosphatase (symmetrical)